MCAKKKTHIYVAPTSNNRAIVTSVPACCHRVKLCALAARAVGWQQHHAQRSRPKSPVGCAAPFLFPYFSAIQCDPPPLIWYATQSGTNYTFGASVTYTCAKDSYFTRNSTTFTTTCHSSGLWWPSPKYAKCLGECSYEWTYVYSITVEHSAKFHLTRCGDERRFYILISFFILTFLPLYFERLC